MLDQVLHIFNINSVFDLNLMKPNQNLTSLTSGVLEVFIVYWKEHFDWIIVQGDITASMAAAIAAFYRKQILRMWKQV
ncbi:MAG: hypothetical protein CM15mP28_3750 [Pseudomonadota bacterium]|nr:MAG: hypothetical protein CM15mP28_3750 [Pseudomonadota bacterium]